MLSTGTEQQGQNSISDPGQNLGFTCIFSSGVQEKPSTSDNVEYLGAAPNLNLSKSEGEIGAGSVVLLLHEVSCLL